MASPRDRGRLGWARGSIRSGEHPREKRKRPFGRVSDVPYILLRGSVISCPTFPREAQCLVRLFPVKRIFFFSSGLLDEPPVLFAPALSARKIRTIGPLVARGRRACEAAVEPHAARSGWAANLWISPYGGSHSRVGDRTTHEEHEPGC